MPSKEQYCYHIMKKHGLIIDYMGEISNVNSPNNKETINDWINRTSIVIDNETVEEWKKRVLGDKANKVTFYALTSIKPRVNLKEKINDVKADVDPEHLQRICQAVNDEVTSTYTNFTKEAIDTILKGLELEGLELEESIKEFFNRTFQKNNNIDAEKLLKQIILNYNSAVRKARESV